MRRRCCREVLAGPGLRVLHRRDDQVNEVLVCGLTVAEMCLEDQRVHREDKFLDWNEGGCGYVFSDSWSAYVIESRYTPCPGCSP